MASHCATSDKSRCQCRSRRTPYQTWRIITPGDRAIENNTQYLRRQRMKDAAYQFHIHTFPAPYTHRRPEILYAIIPYAPLIMQPCSSKSRRQEVRKSFHTSRITSTYRLRNRSALMRLKALIIQEKPPISMDRRFFTFWWTVRDSNP